MDKPEFDLAPTEMQPQYRRPAYGASVFEVLHRRFASVTECEILEADTKVLASQQKLVEQKAARALAELNGRTAITKAIGEAEEAQADVEFARQIRLLPAAGARTLLSAEIETERRLALRSGYRAMRHHETATRLLPSVPNQGKESDPQLDVDVSEEQIAREALQAVVALGTVPPAERTAKYQAWLADLGTRLPMFAADEIDARARKMLATIQIAP